ncbi:ATP-dependent DNA ligase [Nocardioides panacisoli]|uniref:DNA ligase n=1 Tax=Nocardioides panacisoli TaxID=627624 RepID=A0ABP7J4F2_9ACTN
MRLAELVAVSAAVAATRSRKEKTALIADLLGRTEPDERALVAHYLSGRLRQRRTGLGWRGLQQLPPAAEQPGALTVGEVDAAFESISRLSGPGSAGARSAAVAELFGRATAEEQAWLRAIAVGEVRQGALDAIVIEAVAAAAAVPLGEVRRAAMLAGGATYAVDAAFSGVEALHAIGLTVGRPVLPMLASSAPDLASALEKLGGRQVAVDAKLDGIRIQVHRSGADVVVATRSLEQITHRLPEVVEAVLALPATDLVLDGEAIALDEDGRPRPFQETASRTASRPDPEGGRAGTKQGVAVTPYFFDVLHLDGRDLIDLPASERWTALDALVPERHRVPRWVGQADDVEAAQAFTDLVLAGGHEGVVVKDVAAPWEAGRRGAAWVKVKPVHTLDLVVLAVEWGSGRRRGWLSNIHLGARDETSPTGFVMLGKTFKGMTDAMLAWQTERFTELALDPAAVADQHVVQVRPEQVVEIAFDGLQRSSRYPGGLALRFARVVRYRDDKSADEADDLATVRDVGNIRQ